MSKYKVLVLTDHRRHSDSNSIYAILQEMLRSDRCDCIYVVSRGLEGNDRFFQQMDSSKILGAKIGDDFEFTEDGRFFSRHVEPVELQDFDLIFMRLPRPISDEFLFWIEERTQGKAVINRPSGIVETSSKAFLLHFPEQCPDMSICNSIEDVEACAKKQSIVLKPLREYGGKGLLKIKDGQVDDGHEKYDLKDYLPRIQEELETSGYLAMKFLKNVSQGDKRILVVGGEILASSLRLPAEGSWLCNVAQGGTSVPSEVTEEEVEIIKAISPKLMERGILIFGADTLVDDDGKRILSEVNTLSIGGFVQAEEQTQLPIINKTIQKIFDHVDTY